MQSKSIAFIIIVMVAIPIIALSSNHEIFFWVVSLIIAVLSVRYIYRLLSGERLQGTETDKEMAEELEELIDIDVKKVGIGISVVYNMLVILFLCYCAFFLETFTLKVIASLAISLQIHFIIKKTGKHPLPFNSYQHKSQIIIAGILNVVVIIFTVMNKLSKLR